MFNHQENRVLVRSGARLLTAEEAERVAGADTPPSVTTGGGHGTPTDIYCPDCTQC
jgi:hypothetical protein